MKWGRATLRLALQLLSVVLIVILAAWLLGRLTTDRWSWSQWLWWIPTPVAIAAAALRLMLAFHPAPSQRVRRKRVIAGVIMLVAVIVYFTSVEHRMWRRAAPPPSDAWTLVHWNIEPVGSRQVQPSAAQVIQLNGDITVLTNPGGVHFDSSMLEWIGDERSVHRTSVFVVITRWPVVRVQPLIATELMYVSLVEFAPIELLNRPLVMYLVDLPSDPRLSRMAMMKRVRAMLEALNAPQPDIVVGDFNTSRGSASLAHAFPTLTHAFNRAGHGVGATYHRQWPLWHIDHTLIGPQMSVLRHDVIDPQISRHRAQKTWFAPIVAAER